MTQLVYKQHHEPYGRQTFSALSTAFCQSPELSDITSGMVFPGHPISFASVEQSFSLEIYDMPEPTLVVALSECESFAHTLEREDILTVLCQAEFPIVEFLHKAIAKETSELVECLCYEHEFLSEDIEGHITEFQNCFKTLLQAISELKLDSQEMDELIDDVRCERVNRELFLEEIRLTEMKSNQAFFLEFMQRFGRAPGAVTALTPGTPFLLGKGEYLFVGHSFEEICMEEQPCSGELLIDSLTEEIVQATRIAMRGATSGYLPGKTNMRVFEARCDGAIKEVHFSAEDRHSECVATDIFEASKYYLLANSGTLMIDGKKMLVPGQYQLIGAEKLEMECNAGMLDQRTPCFIIIGVE